MGAPQQLDRLKILERIFSKSLILSEAQVVEQFLHHCSFDDLDEKDAFKESFSKWFDELAEQGIIGWLPFPRSNSFGTPSKMVLRLVGGQTNPAWISGNRDPQSGTWYEPERIRTTVRRPRDMKLVQLEKLFAHCQELPESFVYMKLIGPDTTHQEFEAWLDALTNHGTIGYLSSPNDATVPSPERMILLQVNGKANTQWASPMRKIFHQRPWRHLETPVEKL